MPSNANAGVSRGQWVQKLEDICRTNQMLPPTFNIISDRRGGRTAWSSTVTLTRVNSAAGARNVQARFWYDGQYIENAKEDAAEVAVQMLTQPAAGSPSTSTYGTASSSGTANTTAAYGGYGNTRQYGSGSGY